MSAYPLVLLANEPDAYRTLLAAELPFLRPDLRVLEVNPADIDSAVTDFHPSVVICSRSVSQLSGTEFALVILYPEGENTCIELLDGTNQAISDPRLSDILRAIDRALPVRQS